MNPIATVITWTALAGGVGALVFGFSTATIWRHGSLSTSAIPALWMGLFVVMETGPRLASWPSGLVLAISLLALIPLLIAVSSALHERNGMG